MMVSGGEEEAGVDALRPVKSGGLGRLFYDGQRKGKSVCIIASYSNSA